MSPDDLLGVSEIAREHKVTKTTAWRWTKRPDFPAPTVRLSSGPVWRRAAIEKWAAANLAVRNEKLSLRTGRPPKPPA